MKQKKNYNNDIRLNNNLNNQNIFQNPIQILKTYERKPYAYYCQHLDSFGNKCGQYQSMPIKNQPYMVQHQCHGWSGLGKPVALITRRINTPSQYNCKFGCKPGEPCVVNPFLQVDLKAIGRREMRNKGLKHSFPTIKPRKFRTSKQKQRDRMLKRKPIRLNPTNY